MKSSLALCGLLGLMSLATAPAHATDAIGFSEIHAPEPARSWGERLHLLDDATLIEITVRDSSKGSSAHRMSLTRTPIATVGCLVTAADACGSMESLGLVDLPLDLLLDLLVAAVPHTGPGADIPASFRLPALMLPSSSRPAMTVSFSDWSFNPEAGMKMPGEITVRQPGRTLRFEVERFLLVRGPDPIR